MITFYKVWKHDRSCEKKQSTKDSGRVTCDPGSSVSSKVKREALVGSVPQQIRWRVREFDDVFSYRLGKINTSNKSLSFITSLHLYLTPQPGCLKGSLDPGQQLPRQCPVWQTWAGAAVVAWALLALPAPSKTWGGWVCPEGKMETQSATVKGISAMTGKVEGGLETHSKNT